MYILLALLMGTIGIICYACLMAAGKADERAGKK